MLLKLALCSDTPFWNSRASPDCRTSVLRACCCPAGMSHQAARELQQHLERTAAKNAASSSHAQLQAQREALPAAAARGDCLRLLEQHQVRHCCCCLYSVACRQAKFVVAGIGGDSVDCVYCNS